MMKKLTKALATNIRNFRRLASGTDDLSIREWVASKFLSGDGIEIGALDKPLPLPKNARVKYVDRMSVDDLLKEYPDLKGAKLVHVDIVDDGQTLGGIPDDSQDFIIANHFLEHCADPIRTLKNMFRVLRTSGILFLTIPDKRFTFDIKRQTTEFEHVLKDFREGPDTSRRQHFEEWASLVVDITEPEKARQEAENLMKADYSIHYHVWSQKEILELFLKLGKVIGIEIEVEIFLKNGHEVVLIASKS